MRWRPRTPRGFFIATSSQPTSWSPTRDRSRCSTFGLAKLTEPADFEPIDERVTTDTADVEQAPQTAEGTILGTAAYMSPEQAEGKPADARSDVFSFGAVLYEMITGRRAFSADSKMSTLAAVLTKEPEPPSQVVPGLSRDLEKTDRPLSPQESRSTLAVDGGSEGRARGPAGRIRFAQPALSPPSRAGPADRVQALVAGARDDRRSELLIVRRVVADHSDRSGRRPSTPFLTRLTSDVGWTDYPAISLDGKILAYASDRSGDGNLDIWVQQIPDGAPVQADPSRRRRCRAVVLGRRKPDRVSIQPTGGGIYVIPTLGGEERLARGARLFAALFAGRTLDRLRCRGTRRRHESTWLQPLAVLRRLSLPVSIGLRHPLVTRRPIPAVLGTAPARRATREQHRLVRGGGPRRVARSARRRAACLLREGFQAFQGLPFPDAWVRAGNRILFHGHVGDSSNMWQVAISPESWHVSGTPQRATFGTTDEAAASVTSDGRMVFISRTMGADIWSLPIDANRGKVDGPAETRDRRMPQMTTTRRCQTMGRRWCSVRGERPLRRRSEEARNQRRDRPDPDASGSLSSGQP